MHITVMADGNTISKYVVIKQRKNVKFDLKALDLKFDDGTKQKAKCRGEHAYLHQISKQTIQ